MYMWWHCTHIFCILLLLFLLNTLDCRWAAVHRWWNVCLGLKVTFLLFVYIHRNTPISFPAARFSQQPELNGSERKGGARERGGHEIRGQRQRRNRGDAGVTDKLGLSRSNSAVRWDLKYSHLRLVWERKASGALSIIPHLFRTTSEPRKIFTATFSDTILQIWDTIFTYCAYQFHVAQVTRVYVLHFELEMPRMALTFSIFAVLFWHSCHPNDPINQTRSNRSSWEYK